MATKATTECLETPESEGLSPVAQAVLKLADQDSVLAAILKNHPQLSREEALEALKEAGL